MSTSSQRSVPDLGSLRIPDTKRKNGSLGRRLALFFGLLVIVGGAVGAIYSFRSRSPEVEVASARLASGAGGREALLNASGYVTPRRRATIAAKITGRVTGVFFDEGNRVKEGQLLATLDDSDVRRALESAVADRDSSKAAIQDYEVQLRYAEIQLHRATELKAANVQSQDQ